MLVVWMSSAMCVRVLYDSDGFPLERFVTNVCALFFVAVRTSRAFNVVLITSLPGGRACTCNMSDVYHVLRGSARV